MGGNGRLPVTSGRDLPGSTGGGVLLRSRMQRVQGIPSPGLTISICSTASSTPHRAVTAPQVIGPVWDTTCTVRVTCPAVSGRQRTSTTGLLCAGSGPQPARAVTPAAVVWVAVTVGCHYPGVGDQVHRLSGFRRREPHPAPHTLGAGHLGAGAAQPGHRAGSAELRPSAVVHRGWECWAPRSGPGRARWHTSPRPAATARCIRSSQCSSWPRRTPSPQVCSSVLRSPEVDPAPDRSRVRRSGTGVGQPPGLAQAAHPGRRADRAEIDLDHAVLGKGLSPP